MVKHFCDMCDTLLRDGGTWIEIRHYGPEAMVRVELCESCRERVLQMFPQLREEIHGKEVGGTRSRPQA